MKKVNNYNWQYFVLQIDGKIVLKKVPMNDFDSMKIRHHMKQIKKDRKLDQKDRKAPK